MTLWTKKLAAWLHDPAEKALVLMRDEVGHESGSIVGVGKQLGFDTRWVTRQKPDGTTLQYEKLAFPSDVDQLIHRADRLAAGADRPSWPEEKDGFRPAWANVRFAREGVLIHPLSGDAIDLRAQGGLDDQSAARLREASFKHFSALIEKKGDATDHYLSFLAFWRFGWEPSLTHSGLGELWRLLPADTRTPDHSIWAHLDVVSALAGAMADGDEPALLTMSFGPVQGFIAQARSTSDLWAGSHLLSSLVWEGIKIVCERLGPDSVLFPSLRGVAAVDRWLLKTAEDAGRRDAWQQRFRDIGAEWLKSATDANPLFAATLPNKFMALVPRSHAAELATAVTNAVRDAAHGWAVQAATKVFDASGRLGEGFGTHWQTQITDQLRGFPEVQWSVAPWSLATGNDGFPDTGTLEDSLAAFHPAGEQVSGFFADPLWTLLSEGKVEERQGKRRKYKKLVIEGNLEFFVPNHGLLYPAVHDLAERNLAAAKSLHGFSALPQRGYRCTLTGEHEWLTETLEHTRKNPGDDSDSVLHLPKKARESVALSGDQGTAWSKLAGRFGIKQGEHLGALATLKRLWPTLFVEQMREFLDSGKGREASRFVVSTHTMALATSLVPLAAKLAEPEARNRIETLIDPSDRAPALPRSLHFALRELPDGDLAARIPAALDRLRDPDERDEQRRRANEEKLRQLESEVKHILGHTPETYYALIKMDGDRMGAWMAGNEPEYQRKFKDTWHPTVRSAVQQKFGSQPDLAFYMNEANRPPSPARHAAISNVLNNFSTHVARHIVEDIFKGKLIYSGGDDVLAMMSADDLLPAMLLLRAAYSGVGDASGLPGNIDLKGLTLGKGFVQIGSGRNKRLMLMMGSRATASIGAVVAHHQAPLAAVMRDLHSAEKRAKDHGRNAFCLRVIKRGGGEVAATACFWEKSDQPPPLDQTSLGMLMRLADTLAQPGMSRRAVYNTIEWLAGLPGIEQMENPAWEALVTQNLTFQLRKQADSLAKPIKEKLPDLAQCLVAAAQRESAGTGDTARVLDNFLVTAEFFAREGRCVGAAEA